MAFNAPASTPTSQDYDYTSSGIDNFLGRAIDQVSWQTTLDAVLNMPGNETLTTLPPSPPTNTMNMENQAISGSQGNTFTVGNININGSAGNIILSDGTNNTVAIGALPGS